MMPNNPIARFREKFPTRRINRKNAEAYLLSEIILALTRAEEVCERAWNEPEIREIEGVKFSDGYELARKTIKEALASLKDEYTKQ